jgi:hypothetical protein
MRSRGFTLTLFAALVLFAAPLSARADAIAVNGGWNEFSFFAVGVEARGCYPADQDDSALECLPSSGNNSVFAPAPPWTFTIGPGVGTLVVTDAFLHGDSFDVFNNNGFLFSTSASVFDGNGCGDDPDVCLLDASASFGAIGLAPGNYSITIIPNAIGDAGAAYFEVLYVPEPSAGSLMALGIAGLGVLLRSKRYQQANFS